MDIPELPLYEIKANMFKALAHPVRIRVLELLTEADERQVSELLAELSIEPSHLSQHLSVLRHHGVVSSERRANAVFYRLTSPQIVVLLQSARSFLLERLAASGDRSSDSRRLPAIGR